MITAYDAPAARIADEAGVELILVGDTAAMVMLGHASTVPVTLDEMIFLTRAVTRSARPPARRRRPAVRHLRDLRRAGRRERDPHGQGGRRRRREARRRREDARRVQAIADSNIGVMGHIGLTPQSATKLGGFKAQGRTARAAKQLFDDALALEEAGAFAVVLEAVPAPVAARISEALEVPTIGIGAGAGTRRPGARLARHARHVPRAHAAVRQALRGDRGRDRGRGSRAMPPTCGAARSRRSSTPTASPDESSRSSRRRSA